MVSLPGESSQLPPSRLVWVSAPCRAGSRLPGGRAGQAGRQGGPAVGVRPGPCAPPVGSHPAAAVSRSLPGERWRLPRRFGRRARGRAPEAGGDSGNAPGAMRPGKSLLSPEIRAAGPRPGWAAAVGVGRCRCPARWTSAPRGPFCPRAPPGQLSASRKGHGAGVRRVTPSPCFPRARRCGPHGRTQTCPVFPASPMDPDSPDSQRVSSPRRGSALVSRTGGTGRDHGPPVLLPRVRRKRFLASLGERSSRCLHGRPPGGHGSRSSAQDSADGFPAGRAAPIPGAPGVPSILLGLRSGKDGVRVEALCFPVYPQSIQLKTTREGC
ncbi:collagen alpha-1(I) chain-like [Bos indicus]|uniref:Collagen alpha-1(I) chain-like n=1 Tax=Bos indicus TaxID=9915 RepID=A0ABM4T7C8_BOSIN